MHREHLGRIAGVEVSINQGVPGLSTEMMF